MVVGIHRPYYWVECHVFSFDSSLLYFVVRHPGVERLQVKSWNLGSLDFGLGVKIH